MKKLLTLTLALVALVAFAGFSAAQQKAEEKKPPATGEKEAVKGNDATTYKHEITGKVAGVDPTAKTFTVIIQGKAITFSAADLSKLPTVGKIFDITYTWNPGEPPMATSTTESGSKIGTGEEEGQLQRSRCDCYYCSQPFRSLNIKDCPC